MDTQSFMNHIQQSAVFVSPQTVDDNYFDQIKDCVTDALDKFAPLKRHTQRVGNKPTAK